MGILKLPKRFHHSFKNLSAKPTTPVVFDYDNEFGFNPLYVLYERRNILNDSEQLSLAGTVGLGVVDGVGLGTICDGSGFDSYDDVGVPSGTEFTIVIQLRTNSKTANDIVFHQDNTSTSITAGIVIFPDTVGFNSGNTNCFSINIDNMRVETPTDSCPDGETTTLAFAWRGGTNVDVFINGARVGLDITGTAVTLASIQSIFRIGGANVLNDFNGGVTFVAAQNKSVPDSVLAALSADPYQLLKPVVPEIYFTTSGVGAQDISPTGIASTEAFGTAVITTGAVDISPTGIASAEAFGTASLGLDVTPSGIASEEAFGTAVLTTGAVDLTPSGIASEEAFGTAVITQGFVLLPTGIPSTEAFGTAVVTTGAVTVSPTGIASAEAFGSHTIAVAGDKDIKIDFANELVLTSNLQSTTLYFNGTDYFTLD